jgi:hypothetical protein
MKYTLLGFSQDKLLELTGTLLTSGKEKDPKTNQWRHCKIEKTITLDIFDIHLMRYCIDFRDTGKMVKITHEGKDYFWINYASIIKELPLLFQRPIEVKNQRSKEKQKIAEHFRHLVTVGVLEVHLEKNEQGTFSCYRFNEDILNSLRPSHIKSLHKQLPAIIYLMQNKRNHLTKIGCTKKHPVIRERTLQSEEPEISLLLSFPGNFQVERTLHKLFESQRKRGEWFDLSQKDIQHIKEFAYTNSNDNNEVTIYE